VKDKIFIMFFRGTAVSKGSGIGLYIVKEVLEKLTGEIAFSSKLGKGTTFSVFIPNGKS
jgi:signal transduction histidine kinase